MWRRGPRARKMIEASIEGSNTRMPSLIFAAIAERCGSPRPACGERAIRAERKPDLGPVRGRFRKLRLAEAPPHPDLLPARGEKETAVRRGHLSPGTRFRIWPR